MDDDTYLGNLQAAAGAVKREGRDVLLTHAAADAFASALFGLREAFVRAGGVDQIGPPMDPKDLQELSDRLRQSLNQPAVQLEVQEQRWRPDYGWAIDVIEQMLLELGVPMSDLERPWPFHLPGEGHIRDRGRLVAPGRNPPARPGVERGPTIF